AAPDELSTIANVMPAPPMPFLPPEQHGTPIILGMLAFAGPDEAAAAALKPFRALATPLADMVKPGPYMQMFPPEPEGYRPTAVARTMLLNEVDTAAAATILDFLARLEAPMQVCQLRVLGGAIARVPVEATAYAHRPSPIMANLAAFYAGPGDRPEKARWVEQFATALFQGETGAYVNFVGDEGEQRVRAAYPGRTWDRLARIKAAVDPENLFRRNQNIPPAA
ncbi:MAG TPA: FAD-linked oxidase, partial [Alphaproteobacteria bacterium]|nr:FAD-linked oxidase [Alphaproteobacteria bacterium]